MAKRIFDLIVRQCECKVYLHSFKILRNLCIVENMESALSSNTLPKVGIFFFQAKVLIFARKK